MINRAILYCLLTISLLLQIRRKMREIMVNQATSCDLKELVRKFIPESIGKEIEKATSSIYPLQNVFIRKVKILKAPKFDLGKLMEVCNFLPALNLIDNWLVSPDFLLSFNSKIHDLALSIFCLLQINFQVNATSMEIVSLFYYQKHQLFPLTVL